MQLRQLALALAGGCIVVVAIVALVTK